MLIACNESYPQAWLAAHRREVVVWERARALARELDRTLSGHALERHCTILTHRVSGGARRLSLPSASRLTRTPAQRSAGPIQIFRS
jgi:hypothetical protein